MKWLLVGMLSAMLCAPIPARAGDDAYRTDRTWSIVGAAGAAAGVTLLFGGPAGPAGNSLSSGPVAVGAGVAIDAASLGVLSVFTLRARADLRAGGRPVWGTAGWATVVATGVAFVGYGAVLGFGLAHRGDLAKQLTPLPMVASLVATGTGLCQVLVDEGVHRHLSTARSHSLEWAAGVAPRRGGTTLTIAVRL